jgi:isopenicillin N synthase-like dioxygenase
MSRSTQSRPGKADSEIPTIDLGSFLHGADNKKRQVAAQLDRICRSIGFLIIDNHGVSPGVCDRAWTAAKEFFDLSLEQKLELRSDDPKCPRGYFPVAEESLAKTRGTETPPDPKECFSSGPLSAPATRAGTADFDFFYGENRWPEKPEGFREAWEDYYHAMEQLGSQIMQMLATALRVDKDYFAEFHSHHLSALRALNYPATSGDLLPGQQRAGAHSDYGSVTILKPDPSIGGLEVQLPSGDWISAPAVADAFIVNIGDLMARWTNDRWISTLHRVTSPAKSPGDPAPRRQSIAYFMNPNFDARISAIPTCLDSGEKPLYPAIPAGEYLVQKFTSAL